MNWLVKWGVKKYVLGIVNTALKAHETSITRAREIVMKANEKVKAVSRFLDGLDAKLADNKIDDDESDAIVEEAQKLGKELVG